MTRHGRSGELVKLVKLHRMIREKAIYHGDLIIIFNIRSPLIALNLAFLSASFELILFFFFLLYLPTREQPWQKVYEFECETYLL